MKTILFRLMYGILFGITFAFFTSILCLICFFVIWKVPYLNEEMFMLVRIGFTLGFIVGTFTAD